MEVSLNIVDPHFLLLFVYQKVRLREMMSVEAAAVEVLQSGIGIAIVRESKRSLEVVTSAGPARRRMLTWRKCTMAN